MFRYLLIFPAFLGLLASSWAEDKYPWTKDHCERLQQIRAVEVLERVGKREARQLLQTLAEGDREASLTRDATAALHRLRRQP